MGSLLIENAAIVKRDEIQEGCSVYCSGGKIEKILAGPSSLSADVRIDAGGKLLCPGFIDMHTHGVKGYLMEGSAEQLEEISSILPQYGTTAFLAGVCPLQSGEEDIKLLEELSQAKSKGAEILGFFLEGHYLALTGAISQLRRIMGKEHLRKLIKASEPYRSVFAVSPEIEGILDLLPEMTSYSYPAFITHTAATFEQTKMAIDAGATHATHFYNVFPWLNDKEPGVHKCGAIEAVLADPRVSVDFIFDGVHVEPAAVEMALACKGKDKVSIITDSNLHAGMPPGRYSGLSGNDFVVEYEGGPARLTENHAMPGGLTGSGLTMNIAMKNAINLLGVDIPQAVAMVSTNPASALGLMSKGRIEEGYDADMVLLDEDLNVDSCWVKGERKYSCKI